MNFDLMKNFKFYYPHNNIENILKKIRKKKIYSSFPTINRSYKFNKFYIFTNGIMSIKNKFFSLKIKKKFINFLFRKINYNNLYF